MTLLLQGAGPQVIAAAATGYAAEVAADAPLLHWRLGEPSGTTAEDATANNRDGTYSGATLGVTGLLTGDADTAITLDGVDDFVSRAGLILGALTNSTIELWTKLANGYNYANKALYCERAAAGNDIFKLEGNAAGDALRFTHRDDAGTLTRPEATPTAINDNTRHHVVMTKAGTGISFYIDGVAKGTGTLNGTNTLTDAGISSRLGIDIADGSTALAATLDELALYDTALSSTRVTAHWDAGT